MPSHLVFKKKGRIFIRAAGGDYQKSVVRRAARIALKEATAVNYQIVNKDDYNLLDVSKARKIMTPRAWIEEVRDCFSDRLSRKEIKSLTPRTKKMVIAELKKERTELHKQCLAVDREIKKILKSFSL